MVDTSSTQFIVEGFSLLGVSIFLIALRLVARWVMVGWKNFQADDYLMVLAGVGSHLTVNWIANADRILRCRRFIQWKPLPRMR